MHNYVRDISCEPNINVSGSTLELRVRMVLLNMFKYFSNCLLIDPMRCFICGSFFAFVSITFSSRSLQPCDYS